MKRSWVTRFLASALTAAVVSVLLSSATSAAPAPAPQVAAARNAAAGSAFPVTVHSGDGNVTIPARPVRILCLSPSSTQMVYALGAGPQVVGVDEYSSWPADAPRTKFSGAETSAEDYLPLRPDLVILAYPGGTMVQQLRKLEIPVLVLPAATTFADVDSQLAELAAATGHLAAAGAVEASMNQDIAAAVRKAGSAARGESYYIEISPDYYTATSKTFIGAEFSLFGMRDIADPAGRLSAYPQISAEFILKTNPDYVFLADTVCCQQTPTSFAHRPGFSALAAVRLHHVLGVNDSVASQWGPHTIEAFVALIAQTLRP
jgi:iron complex transport system substrate-binding protein